MISSLEWVAPVMKIAGRGISETSMLETSLLASAQFLSVSDFSATAAFSSGFSAAFSVFSYGFSAGFEATFSSLAADFYSLATGFSSLSADLTSFSAGFSADFSSLTGLASTFFSYSFFSSFAGSDFYPRLLSSFFSGSIAFINSSAAESAALSDIGADFSSFTESVSDLLSKFSFFGFNSFAAVIKDDIYMSTYSSFFFLSAVSAEGSRSNIPVPL